MSEINLNEFFPQLIELCKTVTPVIVSGIVSFFVARSKAKSEIKKALLTINREDLLEFRLSFSKLTSAIDNFSEYRFLKYRDDAIKANTQCIGVAPKEFQSLFLEMDEILRNGDNSKITQKKRELLELYSEHIQNATYHSRKKQ